MKSAEITQRVKNAGSGSVRNAGQDISLHEETKGYPYIIQEH